MAQSYDIAIIEDDIYGDDFYQFPRPKTIKSFDTDGASFIAHLFERDHFRAGIARWLGSHRVVTEIKSPTINTVSSSMLFLFYLSSPFAKIYSV